MCLFLAGLAAHTFGGAAAQPQEATGSLAELKAKFKRPDAIPSRRDNPLSPEKAALGKVLFFDPRLSASGTVSCSRCHDPALGWQDEFAKAVGHEGAIGRRRSPPVANLAWASAFMWDGRAEDLETQAALPIAAPEEMNMDPAQLPEVLDSIPGYAPLFEAAYGDPAITTDRILAALATFVRTIVSDEAPFDRWIAGEKTAISDEAKRGFILFNTKARCAKCHSGWRFTDDSFHDIGISRGDLGRGAFVPPEIEVLQHAFKTPGLRDVSRRQHLMHDGSLVSLGAAIDHYVNGTEPRPSLSPEFQRIQLDASERADLIAFLQTLTAPLSELRAPELPH